MSALKDIVKQWFETGDYPTQAQFNTWFDSIRWNDEKITSTDLTTDLLAIINSITRVIKVASGVFSVDIRSGTLLEKFVFLDTTAGQMFDVKIGTTVGGNEIFDTTSIDTTDPSDGILSRDWCCKDDTTIYFTITGAAADTISVNIYKS